MVKEITNIQAFADALADPHHELQVIDFYAQWCGPCKVFAPKFEIMSTRYPNVGFYKIDTDQPDILDVVNACEITSLPTFCFFQNGIYITKISGADEMAISSTINTYLPQC